MLPKTLALVDDDTDYTKFLAQYLRERDVRSEVIDGLARDQISMAQPHPRRCFRKHWLLSTTTRTTPSFSRSTCASGTSDLKSSMGSLVIKSRWLSLIHDDASENTGSCRRRHGLHQVSRAVPARAGR